MPRRLRDLVKRARGDVAFEHHVATLRSELNDARQSPRADADRGFALALLDYMTRQLDLADRWRLHFVG